MLVGPAEAQESGRGGLAAGPPIAYLHRMFDELKRAFRESVAAFRAEVNRSEPEDQVAELLAAMRREWVSARAELPVLAETVERARAELAREREQLAQCERRGAQAERIGDDETARVAAEFAARHRERAGVLERKVEATVAERELREREVQEMKERYEKADANRYLLLAEVRSAHARARRQAVSDGLEGSFSDFQRMEDRISETEGHADAAREVGDLGGPSAPPPDVEDRLRELKERLGKRAE